MKKHRTLAIIMAGGEGRRLFPLTAERTKPAVPFGGIYRIIDFTLSNCVNSGLHRICLLAQYKSLSLQRHLHEGWNFFSYELGGMLEFIPAQQRVGTNWYRGTADAVYQNIYTIRQENPDYVVILAGDHVYKMDYAEMIQFHIDNGAALTVATIEAPIEDGKRFGVIGVDENLRIKTFIEKPPNPEPMPGNPKKCLASMGIYIFNTATLVKELEIDASLDTDHDFGRNIIPKVIGEYPVYAYLFADKNKKSVKYWRDIGTIQAYWEANMDLAAIDPLFNLYDKEWPIRTFQVQAPPAKFTFDFPSIERVGHALDSIVSNGCIISGSTVRKSVISPFVRIHSYCEIDQCVIMNGVTIGRHCKIKRAIIDKYVTVPEHTTIGYDPEEDREKYTVTEEGLTIVSKFTGNKEQIRRGWIE